MVQQQLRQRLLSKHYLCVPLIRSTLKLPEEELEETCFIFFSVCILVSYNFPPAAVLKISIL